MKKHIPNALTSLNLLSGMFGIYFVINGEIKYGAYFIILAAVFDFLDGFVARLLKVSSPIGKELDSLADCVTFGVLPSFILFQMIQDSCEIAYLPFFAFSIAIFSALRLAKFNVDERQSDRFIGVPTPANALLISTLPFLSESSDFFSNLLTNQYFLVSTGFVMSYLLVAEIPLIALKFKDLTLKNNIFRLLIVVFAALFVGNWGLGGIPFAIIMYIALSFIELLLNKDAQITP